MIDEAPLARSPFGASIPPAATRRLQEIEQLGDAIAELSSRIQAATYELLVLIRQFEASGGWNNGCLSVAHWLNWRTGLDLGAAREKVRVARALAHLPLVNVAMQRGRLSYSKVRALTRVATPDNERRLLDFARCGTAAHVERLVRAWRRVDRAAEAKDEQRRHERRELRTWVDDDGMVIIRGRMSPEAGALVVRALEAASERLRHDAVETDPHTEEVTSGQRRADALGLIAESPWRPISTEGLPAIDVKSSSTSTKVYWRTTTRRANPLWRMGRTFPRQRPDGWRATRQPSGCVTVAMAGHLMSGGRHGRYRRPCAVH